MMNENRKKIVVGFVFMLLLAASMLMLHMRSKGAHSHNGFIVYAEFNKVDGVSNGAEVRLAGLKIGQVLAQNFVDDYRIQVEMQLEKDYHLPIDSSVQIETDGLMGAKHLEIVPGADEEYLKSGETFGYTQDVMMINDLLEKVLGYMRNKKGVENEEESD